MLYEGDCLEIMPILPDKSIDMILCDLPYGTTSCKWDIVIPFESLWKEYKRLIRDNGAIVLMAGQPFTSALVMSNLSWFRYHWIWQKTEATGHLNAKKMPMKAHEEIVVFYKKLPTYNPQKTTGHVLKTATADRERKMSEVYGTQKGITKYSSTERYPRSVITFSTDKQHSTLHPTQKPVALFEYLILTYTNEGDLVMDNAAGSGTAGVACIKTKRRCIMIENDSGYCDIIKRRMEQEGLWKQQQGKKGCLKRGN